MYRIAIAAAAATLMMASAAIADPIEGTYRSSQTGESIKVSACGAGFCMSYLTGPHKGKQFGSFKPTEKGAYAGSVTDLNDGDKKYNGKAKMSGKNLVAGGCILGGIICKNVTYTRL